MSKHILVVGAGALGALYAGKLSQAGAKVSVVCRSDYDHVKTKGFRIDSVHGDFTWLPQHTLLAAKDYPYKADYVILTTKVLPSIDGVSLIRDAIHKDTTIVLIQNGIFIEDPFKKAFPDNTLLSTLAFLGSTRVAPGHINHTSFGHLKMGQFPEGIGQEALQLKALFEKGGVKCDLVDTIQKERWRKMAWNAPFNLLSVIANGATTAQLLRDHKPLIISVMNEILSLAKTQGFTFEETLIDKLVTYTENMGDYKTSMLADYEAHRTMEIDAILGTVIRFSKTQGCNTPVLDAIYSLCNAYQHSNTTVSA